MTPPVGIAQQRWLLKTWLFSIPLGYIAVESGWIVRCVGRQPWTVYGEIRTVDAASQIPASDVLASLTTFAVVYSILFVFAIYFATQIIRGGANLDLPVPGENISPELDTTKAQHRPDSRPAEAKQ